MACASLLALSALLLRGFAAHEYFQPFSFFEEKKWEHEGEVEVITGSPITPDRTFPGVFDCLSCEPLKIESIGTLDDPATPRGVSLEHVEKVDTSIEQEFGWDYILKSLNAQRKFGPEITREDVLSLLKKAYEGSQDEE